MIFIGPSDEDQGSTQVAVKFGSYKVMKENAAFRQEIDEAFRCVTTLQD